MHIQRDIFPLRGAETGAKPTWALPVINQVSQLYSSTAFVASTDFIIGAGAAGTSVTIHMKYGQILSNFGRVGSFGNSSFVWGGAAATTFTTEVAFVANTANTGGDTTNLTNGQYMIDYETGIVYGKKADAGTTGTATYSYWLGTSASSGGGGELNITEVGGVAISLGQKAKSASLPVTIASDQEPLKASTGAPISIASLGTSQTLLASNASRKNATFFNNSTSALYLKYGTTASAADFNVKILAGGYFELPVGAVYTGRIDGIWDTANGACLVTELT